MRNELKARRSRPARRSIANWLGTPDNDVICDFCARSQNPRDSRVSLVRTSEAPAARWLFRMDMPNEYDSSNVVIARSSSLEAQILHDRCGVRIRGRVAEPDELLRPGRARSRQQQSERFVWNARVAVLRARTAALCTEFVAGRPPRSCRQSTPADISPQIREQRGMDPRRQQQRNMTPRAQRAQVPTHGSRSGERARNPTVRAGSAAVVRREPIGAPCQLP